MYSVGVIGAGQLARMMQVPAIELGIDLKVFAEAEAASAALSASRVGDYTDFDQLLDFAKSVNVITFDHEHVPADLLRKLEAQGLSVRPGPAALIHAQNKLTMRKKLAELGLPQPAWLAARTSQDVASFLLDHGPEIVVKTPIGGYDGKGVRVISEVSEVQDWLENLGKLGGELLLEQKVDFSRELAQLCARRPSGEFSTWQVVETRQAQGVCSEVISPAPNADGTKTAEIAKRISEGLGVIGVMAVELFEAPGGEILVNELAMRPHNSGHFSIEGSQTSQFEQHLRAVLDLPLGSTKPTAPHAVMLNLLGVDDQNDFVSRYPKAMREFPDVSFHNYQKSARKGRKMGHLTAIGDDQETLLRNAQAARAALYGAIA
ncbi:MAG TPA: 5-(carboxyamino)imidazole ribonucleotide synthase [Aquiluna sp.]